MPKTLSNKIVLAAGLLTALLAATLLSGGFGLANADNAPSSTSVQSDALARQAPLPQSDPANSAVDQRLEGAALLAVARQVEDTVPLPPGGSFDDIDWKGIGSTSTAGVRSFVEYNASCDWYRYLISATNAKDAAATKSAADVVQRIADWPSFRGAETGQGAASIATAAATGDLSAARAQIKVNCG